MTKTKSKKTVSDNFENLKAQMMKKRILAESQEVEQDNDKLKEENEYSSNEDLNSEDTIVNVKPLVIEDTIPKSSVSTSKIIIKKVEKPEQPKRITYYLKPETIKKIDKYSKMAGMGKSEFVQKLLDEVLDNLEIEK